MQHAIFGDEPSGRHDIYSTQSGTRYCFKDAWNSEEGRFTSCFLPFIAALPAFVAVCILLWQALAMLLRWRPRWTKPFIVEYTEEDTELVGKSKRDMVWPTAGLLTVSLLGSMAQAGSASNASTGAEAVLPAASWVCETLIALWISRLIYIDRRSAPCGNPPPEDNAALESSLIQHHFCNPVDYLG